ncbi:MAG: TonB-dependent receptor [Bryobacteraceae bacterium]
MSSHQPVLSQLFRHSLLVLLAIAIALPLTAQSGLGVVHGTVTDQTQAIVPGAKVTLLNLDNGVAQTVESTGVGAYYFGSVRQGRYSVTVEMAQFKKWTGTLVLEVGQSAVVDPVLQVGSTENVVEVTGAAPVIETEKGSLSDVKDATRIRNLPLNGRQITNLFNLTAGVEGGGAPHTNGMKVGSTDMALDGISLVDRFGGGISRVQPGLDIIQEFRFETAGSDAAFSRPSSVTLVSKSGTNQWHGNAFETFRNNYGGLLARARQDTFTTPPKLIRNEYGGTVSGPIVKNKAFWLYSYEAMKLRQQVYSQTQVPGDAMWNGDFSGFTDTSGAKYTIYDPLTTGANGTRSPFPGNVIQSSRIAPIAGVMRAITPKPTDLSVNPYLTANFQVYYPKTQDFSTHTGKFDQHFSEKDNLSVRFTHSNQDNVQSGGRFGFPPLDCSNCNGTQLTTAGLTSVVAREVHVFRPNLINEFAASVNRSPNHQGGLSDGTNWADKLGLPNPFGATGWPSIYTSDSQFLYYGGWDADNFKDQAMTQFQLEDNVTWVKGKHTMQFGFRGRTEANNVREMQQAQGSHSFYGDWTQLYDPASQSAVPFTGSGFASLELGLPTYLSNQFNRGYFYFRQKEFGLYAQDSWKVSRRLTVNLGLRWDKWTPYSEKRNRLVNLDLAGITPTNMQVITPNDVTMESLSGVPAAVLSAWARRGTTWTTANQAGIPGGLTPGINRDLGPRLGMAYRLTDKTVLRGSYGIYYWTMPLSQILQSSRTNPPLNLAFENAIASAKNTDYVYALSHAPAPTDSVGTATVTASDAPGGARLFTPFDFRHWNDDMMQQWTFVIEREVGKNSALRLSYIGNHGSNLEQRWAYNDPTALINYRAETGLVGSSNADTRRYNPNWSGQAVKHNGYSNTQSFQFEFNHKFAQGLTFQGFYTYAHAMSTTDAGGSSSGDGNANATGSGYSFLVPQNGEILGNPNLTDSQRLRLGYANSGDVPPQHVRWNGVYDLPFGKGKRFAGTSGGVMNQIIGGWSIGFIGDWRSGFWTGVNAGYYLFGDPTLSKDNRVTADIFGRQQQVYFRGYFDSSQAQGPTASAVQQLVPVDFSQRVMTRLGNNNNQIAQTLANGTVVFTNANSGTVNWNARNFLQGPGAWNQDLSLYKTITFKERYKVRLTGDFFNAFNHPNNLSPNTTTGLIDLSQQSNGARIIQLSARFEF